MDRMERHRVVAEYVRGRVAAECQTRGRAARIAEKTGFTRGYLSRLLKEDVMVGPEFARQMAALWEISFEELERLAFQAKGLPVPAPTTVIRDLPHLRDTIEWCQQGKVYPYRFLRQFERQAELQGVDRSRREWMIALEEAYQVFEKERAARPSSRSKRPRIDPKEEPSGIKPKPGAMVSTTAAGKVETGGRRRGG